MSIEVISFDGFALDGATYQGRLPTEGAAFARSSAPILLDTIGGYPRDEGFRHQAVQLQLVINVRTTLTTGMDALKEAFRVGRSGLLIIEVDGDARQRTCRVESSFPFAPSKSQFLVNLVAADGRWRSTSETTVTETVTANGQTWDVVNDGNATVEDAVITFQPVQQKAGTAAQKYRRYAIVANRVGEPYMDPIDLTNGGIDHAALVTAVKSQADGDDLRVLRDGIELARYLGEHANNAANSATTKVWCTPGFAAMAWATLLTSITNVSPANGGDIEVLRGHTQGWPPAGAFVNNTTGEVIRYDGLADPDVDGYDGFKNIKRGQWGTTAASMTAGQTLYRVQHKLEVIYGWTNAPAPESRPELKPMFNLASSTLTNLRWEWLKLYDDVYPSRPGQWSRLLQARDSQAAWMYLPSGQPTGATWRYNYGPAEPDEQPYNVITKRTPSGTDGTSGQIGFTYDIDATLQLRVIGHDAEGNEILAKTIHGAAATTFSSTLTNVLKAVSLYARSQVVLSVPDYADRLISSGDGLVSQIAALNTAAVKYIVVENDLDEPLDIRGGMAMVYFDGATRQAVNLSLQGDDGNGAPSGVNLGISVIDSLMATSHAAAAWVGGVWTGLFGGGTWDNVLPAVLMPGANAHVKFDVPGTTHSAVVGFVQYAARADGAYPWWAYRLLGDSIIHPDARAELGETVAVTAVGIDLLAAGVPYFSLGAEESCYQADHVLVNNTTGQELRFNLYIGATDEIEIDCGRRSVRNVTTGEEGLVYGVTTREGQSGFFSLAPGTNELQLDDAGVVEVDFAVTFRAAWE